nr:CvpA family protein [Maliibacterium massiliense]
MNIIDVAILAAIAVFVILGWYRGFLNSAMHIASFFLSWGIAAAFYRPLAHGLDAKHNIVSYLLQFGEGADRIADVELARTPITQLSAETVADAVQKANYPSFIEKLLQKNITGEVFADKGIATLAEYFNQTVMCVILNILCFVGLFVIAMIVLSVIIAMANAVLRLPVLHRFDGLMGAGMGLIMGLLIVQVLFMLVPAVMPLLPYEQIENLFSQGMLSSLFYKGNFFLQIIRGTV